MQYVANLMLLIGLFKLFSVTRKPVLCAGIYAGAASFFAMILGEPLGSLLLGGVILFALSFAYFWVLDRVEWGTPLWIGVVVTGLLVALV